MKELEDFLSSKKRNGYIYCQRFTIYVRKSFHNIKGVGVVNTFDIANIHLQEKLRGRVALQQCLTTLSR